MTLEHKRKFFLGLAGIIAVVVVAFVGKADPHVCYSIAGIATGVGVANAIKSKNGK